MNILITGGMGFIGSNLAEFYAQDSKNRITIIDNLSRHKENLFLFDSYDNVTSFQIDLRDYRTLDMMVKSSLPSVVFHCAGQTAVTTSMDDPKGDFENNVVGTVNLLETLRKLKNKPLLIFTSTNKVYGDNINSRALIVGNKFYDFFTKEGINEKFPIDHTIHTPYGCSKLAADLYVQEYGKTYGLKTFTLRMSCIYGIRQFGIEDQGWVAHFVWSALKGEIINIFGDGKQVRDILYVDDLVRFFDCLVKNKDKLGSTVFNIGGGRNHTVSLLELIELLEDLLDKKIKVKFNPWRRADQKVYISDISKAKNLVGWEPSVKIKEGISKLIWWCRDLLEDNF